METGKWKIHFLRKSSRTERTFTDDLALIQASDDVDEEAIVGICPLLQCTAEYTSSLLTLVRFLLNDK